MKKIVRLTESELKNIIKKIVLEGKREHKRELELKNKLDDIFFQDDPQNLFSDPGQRGYLSRELRLSKEISPQQRKERIEQVIEELENYIRGLKDSIGEEETFMRNPDYDEQWSSIEYDEEEWEDSDDV